MATVSKQELSFLLSNYDTKAVFIASVIYAPLMYHASLKATSIGYPTIPHWNGQVKFYFE